MEYDSGQMARVTSTGEQLDERRETAGSVQMTLTEGGGGEQRQTPPVQQGDV